MSISLIHGVCPSKENGAILFCFVLSLKSIFLFQNLSNSLLFKNTHFHQKSVQLLMEVFVTSSSTVTDISYRDLQGRHFPISWPCLRRSKFLVSSQLHEARNSQVSIFYWYWLKVFSSYSFYVGKLFERSSLKFYFQVFSSFFY